MRFCPSCQTERAVSEVSCEGSVRDRPCNWDLLNVQIVPEGWRPQAAGDRSTPPPQPVPGASFCPNGHTLNEGDFICSLCGEEPIAQRDRQVQTPAPQPEVVIPGWHVLHRMGSAIDRREKYLVEAQVGGTRGVLTLYHQGWEPSPDVYSALGRISLEHVPRILATGQWEDRVFDVAEALTGESLSDIGFAAANSLGVRQIVLSIGKALNALSEAGLRHRNISPGALMVRNREPLDLVLGDFGSARVTDFELDVTPPNELTHYTAPEAVVGGVAAASDWWSLGILLLELVTDRRYFEGIDAQAFLIGVIANGPPIPRDLPPDIALLLRGLLARDRSRRWNWTEVSAWLDGQSPVAPESETVRPAILGPELNLGGVAHRTLSSYAVAASAAANWDKAREQLLRGVLTNIAQEMGASPQQLAMLRRIVRDESIIVDDWRLLVALKAINPDMPPVLQGAIISPKWLMEHPLDGYALISSQIPNLLHELDPDNWIYRLKTRESAVRVRAEHLGIDLDEDTLRVYLLSNSKSRRIAEWDKRRSIFPDSDHPGLLNLLERRSLGEDDLIIVLSAAPSQFRSFEAVENEARELAKIARVTDFDTSVLPQFIPRRRAEVHDAVADRIADFVRCQHEAVNDWADRFRNDRRISLAQALVLLSLPANNWNKPPRQQYVSHLLSFFEKKSSLLRCVAHWFE